MLARAHRLVDGESFRRVTRQGRRAAASTMVVHLWTPPEGTEGPSQVGFVVSKAVGNAVVRNRVKRQLRHLIRQHLDVLPDSCVVVVRALPPAGSASGADLDGDLRHCLTKVQAL